MPEVIYKIDGKRYSEEEVIKIYQFWRHYCDTNDIDDEINHVKEYGNDRELSDFAVRNTEMIRSKCIEHLSLWHDIQRNSLNSWDESIFDFALQLIDIIYYDKEGKLAH